MAHQMRRSGHWRIAGGTVFLAFALGLALDCARPAPAKAQQRAQSGQHPVFVACGEPARKASERMRGIVDAIDGVWDAHVRVYQSVAMAPPHARPGGCVMYNPAYMNMLMQRLMIRDSAVADTMLYAIMAHEVGHELHGDFSSQRTQVSSQTRELQADRFAGYTLERLGIGVNNITPYYSLAGDEFNGGQGSGSEHGVSMSRTQALKTGWDRAEWNQPEDSHALSDDD